ncbi:MAG: MarR family transcriptional regulator [Acidimicrobiia bacterium]|nr:MarR family transcriptional regulator [Acidimicrobiia bacterium]
MMERTTVAQGSAPTARVVRVLEALRLAPDGGLRYAELAQTADVSQATCHAILATLTDAGYVVRDPASKAYSLGPALLGLGDAAARAFPEVQLARVELDALASETGLRCHAAKVVDDAITVVAVAGAAEVDDPIRPGTRIPFAPPFGAIHVAWSSPHIIEQWIRRAPSASFTAARLHDVVEDHRRTRVAVAPYTPASARLRELLGELAADEVPDDVRDRTIELLGAIDRLDYTSDDLTGSEPLAVNTLTAPVFDRHGKVAFAIGLHVAEPELPADRIEALASALVSAADRMTELIGGRVPSSSRPIQDSEHSREPVGG